MGRAIDMENKLDALDRRLKLVEGALEELVQNGTRVQHVDLTAKTTKETETTPPPVETKKTTRSVKKTVSA